MSQTATALVPVVEMRQKLLQAREKYKGTVGTIVDDRCILIACTMIEANPRLLECTPASVFSAIVRAGAYGWVCDGLLGQASLVPFRDNKTGTTNAVLIPGYKGMLDLVRRAGEANVSMEAVHAGDEFTYCGRFREPSHVYSKDPKRRFAPVTGAYVLAQFGRDGASKCFYWSREECLAHRDKYSQNWRRNPKEDNPWHEKNPSFRVMCMKTVLLDAIHRGEIPVSISDRRLIDAAARADGPAAEPLDVSFTATEEQPAAPEPQDDQTPDAAQEWSPDVARNEEEAIAEALAKATAIGDVNKIEQALDSNPNLTDEAKGGLAGLCAARRNDIQHARGERTNKR